VTRLVGVACVALALALAPAIARADCDANTVGGERPFCPNRGIGYHPTMTFSVDLAAVASRVVVSERSAAEGGVDPGPRDARGASFRFLGGVYGIYFAGEIVGLSLDRPMRVAAARGDMAAPGLPGGAAVEIRILGGVMRSRGRLLGGVELGFGLRDVFGELADSDEERFSAQGLLDLRAMGGVWLTPHISLAVQLGVGLVRDEHMTAIMFGYSPLPFNGTR
jgi:hypothetical protein